MTKPQQPLDPKDPRHGKHAGYQAGCRCEPCYEGARLYDLYLAYDHSQGIYRIVDADKARSHIEALLAWGVRYESFGKVSTNAGRVMRGELTRIHAASEAQILSVSPEPGVNCFAAFSVTRRLQSLIALGHSQSDLVERLGRREAHVSMLVTNYRGQRHVATDLWHDADRVFRELCMTPGTSTRSLNRGKANRWAVPLAWDNIDDPFERPYGRHSRGALRHRDDVDHAVVTRLLDGERGVPSSHAEKREVTRIWQESGRPLADLERRLGWKPERYLSTESDTTAEAS